MAASNHDDDELFRLRPSELMMLTYQLASRYSTNLSPAVNDFHLLERAGKKIVICPMSKDAENRSNEQRLPFIGDLVQRFFNNHPVGDYKLLLPLKLCRGYFKLPVHVPYAQRKHAVLAELDIEVINEQTICRLSIHDSQGWIPKFCYPDKFSEIMSLGGKKFHYIAHENYHAYGRQRDNFSCGYFVLKYIELIVEQGHSQSCERVVLKIDKTKFDKIDYLKLCDINATPDILFQLHLYDLESDSDSEKTEEEYCDIKEYVPREELAAVKPQNETVLSYLTSFFHHPPAEPITMLPLTSFIQEGVSDYEVVEGYRRQS